MSTMNSGPTPPGWYPQDGQLRYWDGQQWTAQTAPLTPTGLTGGPVPGAPMAAPAPTAPEGKRSWYRKKRFLIPIGSLVVIGALSNLSGGGKTETTTPVADSTPAAGATSSQAATPAAGKTTEAKPAAPAKTQSPAKPASQLGQPVRDGKLEFVVKDVKCGIAKVGDEYLNKTAQGQFCSVGVTVTNIGDEPQSMFADNQYAYDAKDRRFSASSEAAIYADDSKLLFEEINPGNTLSGRIYFDMPKDQSPVKLKLYDSAFSGGVEVRLS